LTDSQLSERHLRLYAALAQIPPGCVMSYGELAAQAGLGRAARWVGRVLAQLPDDSRLPWHRVLRADGRLGLAADNPSAREQCERLRTEGVLVENGRVNRRRYRLPSPPAPLP